MERKDNSILRQLVGVFVLPPLFAVTLLLYNPRPVSAQSAADGPAMGAPSGGDESADNLDLPAPSADYDRPDEAGAVPIPDAETAGGTDDQVLVLPQIIDRRNRTMASAPAGLDGDTADSAGPADVTFSNPPVQSDPDDQSAQAAAAADDDGADDVQSYADQDEDDGSGPVVVYAAPVYVPIYQVPVNAPINPLPQPYTAPLVNSHQLPMYSALSSRTLPMYSALMPFASRRYNAGGGTRLFGSHLGLGHGSMMGGFSRGR